MGPSSVAEVDSFPAVAVPQGAPEPSNFQQASTGGSGKPWGRVLQKGKREMLQLPKQKKGATCPHGLASFSLHAGFPFARSRVPLPTSKRLRRPE